MKRTTCTRLAGSLMWLPFLPLTGQTAVRNEVQAVEPPGETRPGNCLNHDSHDERIRMIMKNPDNPFIKRIKVGFVETRFIASPLCKSRRRNPKSRKSVGETGNTGKRMKPYSGCFSARMAVGAYAVETGDHYTNGASLKSQTIRASQERKGGAYYGESGYAVYGWRPVEGTALDDVWQNPYGTVSRTVNGVLNGRSTHH